MPRRKKEEEEAMSDSDRVPRGAANARERMRMRQGDSYSHVALVRLSGYGKACPATKCLLPLQTAFSIDFYITPVA